VPILGAVPVFRHDFFGTAFLSRQKPVL
jgi:hypothetical protein